MEEVYLTSDILFNYILPPAELVSDEDYEDKAEAWRHKYEIKRRRHEHAVALFNRISAGQVTVYLSDVVLFEAIKAIEAVPFEEEPVPEDLESQMQWVVRGSWVGQRINDTLHIVRLIRQPNVLGIDKEKWQKILQIYANPRSGLPLEVAYHAATAERLNSAEGANIRGIVSFDEVYDNMVDLDRIDPASFQ